jgi:glycosyltransferase involved in cell wall biosynthesis
MTSVGDLVSVMIGVYNGERYIGEAIDSALEQTHRPLEVIVIDDGSEDGTADVVAAYGRKVRHERQERAGNGAARNRAVELAAGDYFAFLDADDRFVPDKLERQLEVMRRDPTVDVVFGHVHEFISPDLDADAAQRLRRPMVDVPWLAPNLMLVRRASFMKVGPFSSTLRVGVTVDWYARSVEAGLKSYVVPHVVLERRLHSDNNGLREQDSRSQYLHVLKASLDRRRAAAARAERDRSD